MNWYIQPLSHDFDTSQRIAYLAEERGVNVISEKYPGFNQFDMLNGIDGPILFLGSINALKAAQNNAKYSKYCLVDWCDWQALRCSKYYPRWGELMLTRYYCFLPLADVIRQVKDNHLWNCFSHKNMLFIKPDTNDKAFNGELVHRKNIDAWIASIEAADVDPTLLCLIGTPEDIESEYRLVIWNKKVISSTSYRLDGKLEFAEGCPEKVAKLAEEAAQKWSPDSLFVMDVALSDGVARIIECGSVNVAGFYQCKLPPIVDAFIEQGWKEIDY